jgi:hypothetical protein
MPNFYEEYILEFKEFIGKTSLDPEEKLKYLDLFGNKGYLTDEEAKSLAESLHAENEQIENFIQTNLKA